MNNYKTRFVINVNGTPRTVLSVRQTPNIDDSRLLDLNIHVTSGGRSFQAATMYELVATADESEFKECEKHISVHCNARSATTNTIKKTLRFSKDDIQSEVQITTGIKQDNLFVPVLFRVCGDLSQQRYCLPVDCDDELITLGELDPQKDQLRCMIVVSQKGTTFKYHEEHPSNINQIELNDYNLAFIWSFLNQRSHPQAIDFFLTTTKESGPLRGLDWFEIYNLYTNLNMTHAAEYFRVWAQEPTDFQQAAAAVSADAPPLAP